MLFWRCSINCYGTTSHSPLTLSRRWWNYRASRCQLTNPLDTALCFTSSMTHLCLRSVLVCWRKVFANWTHILHSLVRQHCSQSKIRSARVSDLSLCHFTGKQHLGMAVLHCLRLLDLALQKEVMFMDLLRESQASMLVSPLEQLLQGVSPQTRRADHIVNIAR